MKLGGQYAVHLHDDSGQLHSWLPGDEVPDWAATRITNPYAWEGVDAPTALADPVTVILQGTAAAPAGDTPDEKTSDDTPAADPAPTAGEMPPKSGLGATRQVWADYAESKGITVEAGWKREDIITAVEKAAS